MSENEIKDRLIEARVIAVVRAGEVEISRSLAQAYIAAGIRAIELTTSIPDWRATIAEVAADCGEDTLIGLGTVISPYDAIEAINLGAKFIVSPYICEDVIEAANMRSLPVIPGALTPSEIAYAYELGADMVKVFPASSVGGPSYIKALLAPMPAWQLIPTGGVTRQNAIEYLRAGAVAVGLGSNMAPADKVEQRDWCAVTDSVRTFLDELREKLEEGPK